MPTTEASAVLEGESHPCALDRLLRIFGDVRSSESGTALLMLTNIFLILTGYYICKTVREPLILTSGGAEVKSYSAAGQALLLMAFIPLYSWFASKVDRARLIFGMTLLAWSRDPGTSAVSASHETTEGYAGRGQSLTHCQGPASHEELLCVEIP